MTTFDADFDTDIHMKVIDPTNIMELEVIIKVTNEESLWYPATYKFKVTVPPNYPYEGPKCLCLTKVR